ncbi:MAG: NAD(P)/FAD-dependent oxidoreductase [Planctomycetota bacterium]|nr:NAD(P)/FAD-dependent oxidoreductase [Planctomycetota bacterium]
MPPFSMKSCYDIVIVGSGHNGLVAAAYLAKAGLSVLVLERNDYIGGATASQRVFPDYDALLSRYAYLVSLLPPLIVDELQLKFETRRRSIASFTPYKDASGIDRGLVFSNVDQDRTRQSLQELTGGDSGWESYQRLQSLQSAIARVAWPSLLQPLQSRETFRSALVTTDERAAWKAFVERPLGESLESLTDNDVLRGLWLTDAKIGVFTQPHDTSLLQNRCFLYHVIGNETGEWRVPVGGMKSFVDSLIDRCLTLGVTFATDAPVTNIECGPKHHTVSFTREAVQQQVDAVRILVNAGPRTFSRLLGEPWNPVATDEGSVIKMNMLLHRLPRVKASGVSSAEAFSGSFHIDEGYDQMLMSYQQASRGELPDPAPAEMYCHTLTDNSILSPELQSQGYHTLTLFGLDMPYRVFKDNNVARREAVKQRYLAGLDRICVESFVDCLAIDRNGAPCIEIKTPVDLERELDLDQGNIFHNTLSWFFTDDETHVGQWGVETHHARIYRAGSSAFRGGAVSGIPGRNAAMCVLAGDSVG